MQLTAKTFNLFLSCRTFSVKSFWSWIYEMTNILPPARLLLSGPTAKKVIAFWASSIRNMVWLIWRSILARSGKNYDTFH